MFFKKLNWSPFALKKVLAVTAKLRRADLVPKATDIGVIDLTYAGVRASTVACQSAFCNQFGQSAKYKRCVRKLADDRR